MTRIADQLPTQPEMFPPDKFKRNNDGTWRAFEKFHYRISYLITAKEIRIVRMRHTSRLSHPLPATRTGNFSNRWLADLKLIAGLSD